MNTHYKSDTMDLFIYILYYGFEKSKFIRFVTMGAKALYIDNRKKYQLNIYLEKDLVAIIKMKKGHERWNKYHASWEIVDLDALVNRLFKNPVYKNIGQKFTITDESSNYIIYCDNSESYFRIGDKRISPKYQGHYLNKDLQQSLNITKNGKIVGLSKESRMSATHFRIKKE